MVSESLSDRGKAGACASTDRILDLGYTFDNNANVGAITDYTATARQTRGMTYDSLDRLTQTTGAPFGTAIYGYNVLDNLTTVNVTGGSKARNHTYVYDIGNRLVNVKNTVGGATVIGLGYDVQGNLNNNNGVAHAFDYGNRLRSVTYPATPSLNSRYTYDGLGRRVQDEVGGLSKQSMYLQNGQLSMTGDGRTNTVTEYVYLQGSLIALRERNTVTNVYATRYQHTDALGTPLATTDASKNFIEKSEYEPYGQLVNATLKDGPGYTGHVMDAATGLIQMQQRYMDPGIGLFLSVDPVTAFSNPVGMFNRYRYAANNPYRFIDPDGRCEALTGTRIKTCPRQVKPSDVQVIQHFDHKTDSITPISNSSNVPSDIGAKQNDVARSSNRANREIFRRFGANSELGKIVENTSYFISIENSSDGTAGISQNLVSVIYN